MQLIKADYHPKEEYPIGNDETVDLAITGKNKNIAIEIETGKSDAIRNIRKCLKAGFEVVSIPSNPDTLKKTKLSLKHFSDQELKKIRIRSI